MTALKNAVVEATSRQVQITYLDRETAKWWNARRKPDEPCVFCGWYWVRGDEEAGPFRSRSSALRDAFFKFVLRREMPAVGHRMVYPPSVKQFRRKKA